MNKDKIIYWVSTAVLCGMMLMSAGMYLFNNPMAVEAYTALGYPTYLIYISATLKILGVVAILSKKSAFLKEWAYAGFFYVGALGLLAHVMVKDGQWMGAAIFLVALVPSYIWDRKLYK